jgi:hypothetical protein
MFPLSFPFNALARAGRRDWVLDPFCGRGTTILAARLRGLASVGLDSNPVATAIAGSKLARVHAYEVIALARSILEATHAGPVTSTPQGEFWDRCYAPKTLREICRIRNYLLGQCSTRVEVALRGLMLGILHGPRNKGVPSYLSNQMPRTYSTKPAPATRYWQRHGMKPVEISTLDVISRRSRFSFEVVPASTLGKIITADSRRFDFSRITPRCSWIITSPPYYGMRTYFPDQWLRNWFVGGPSDVDYRTDEQLSHQGDEQFVSDLAVVWRRAAEACLPGAKLICRFGALPSRTKDPRDLCRRSLVEAMCGWRITTIRDAGTSGHGRRQCDQFGIDMREPLEEIDVYAMLEP